MNMLERFILGRILNCAESKGGGLSEYALLSRFEYQQEIPKVKEKYKAEL